MLEALCLLLSLGMLRPLPTGLTPIVGCLPSADSRGFKILNMFDRGSRPTIKESTVESVNSSPESANSTANSATNPLKIGLWVRAFSVLCYL